MNNDAIIVYRSRAELEMDNFMQSTGWPWIYENGFLILLVIAALCFSPWLYRKYQDWRN